MTIRILTSEDDLQRYDAWVKQHPQGSLWQSIERKSYIEALGKETRIYVCEDQQQICASALVVIDRTTFGLSTWEMARGPLWNDECRIMNYELLLDAILSDAKRDRCMTLYFSPYTPLPATSIHHSSLITHNSPRLVHCQATRILDLTLSENELLKQMKPKGRYNIKVARKHGVTVQESDDIDAYYQLATETGNRDHFQIPSKKQLQAFVRNLEGNFMLLAYANEPTSQQANKPIAGLLGVIWNGRGIYYYGASSHAHRALMAPYLLQWEVIQRCRELGCKEYDLLGIAPESCKLQVISCKHKHPWAGISKFKEKFGGAVVEYSAEQMVVLRPVARWLLEMKRKVVG